ncbi:hypothetical protein XA68_11687 [Ophiocordyceps unilateralis]|uniref:Uncharacterized protein n=1 Tax=Ophiocordyceps unilateralis TaxID=268505 RepID=A0A2A9NXT2_OPHUN|nr:hypothetical protein XA68_11687 [Ophiocordyceps unilateralis]
MMIMQQRRPGAAPSIETSQLSQDGDVKSSIIENPTAPPMTAQMAAKQANVRRKKRPTGFISRLSDFFEPDEFHERARQANKESRKKRNKKRGKERSVWIKLWSFLCCEGAADSDLGGRPARTREPIRIERRYIPMPAYDPADLDPDELAPPPRRTGMRFVLATPIQES